MTYLDELTTEGRPIPNTPDLADRAPYDLEPSTPDPQPPVDVETPPVHVNGHGRPGRTRTQAAPAKPPPHDTAAEAALLGAALISTTAADLVATIDPAAFYTPLHGRIAHAIHTLHAQSQGIDPITVAGRLHDHGHTDQAATANGLATVMEMATNAPSSHATGHAERVRDLYRARRMQIVGEEISRAAQDGRADAAYQLLEGARDAHQAITNAPTIPTLGEFLDVDEPDHVWAIPGLMETTDRLLLTSPEGGGKSTLLRQIAVQTAAGIHPFTHHEMSPLRVLLLDLENSTRHIRREIRPLHTASHHQAIDNLHIASLPAGLDLTDTHDARLLEGLVADTGAQLIVGGPVYKLVGGDPTEEGPARAAALLIDRLRDRHQCAWMLETHQPHESGGKRPERPYGASLWKRWPEFGLHLGDNGQLRHWRGDRDQRDWPAALLRGGEWPWTVAPPRDATFARAVELSRNAGRQLSYRDLGQQMGASKSQIERMIKANPAEWDALRRELEDF